MHSNELFVIRTHSNEFIRYTNINPQPHVPARC